MKLKIIVVVVVIVGSYVQCPATYASQNRSESLENCRDDLSITSRHEVTSTEIFTPKHLYWFNGSRFELTPRVVAFLDRGGRMLGKLIVRGESFEGQLRAVADFVTSQLSYNENVALNPPHTFDELLLGRRAGCVHFALLTAAILAESGFSMKLVMVQPEQGYGHLWLEVYADQKDLAPVTYIVDTAGVPYVKTYAAGLRDASADRSGLAAEFYTSPERRYYEVR